MDNISLATTIPTSQMTSCRTGSWAVLVAGESFGVMRADKKGTREGKYLGGHCSLQNIVKVYDQLLEFLPANQIIVIAQLQETLEWLSAACSSPDACQRMAGRSSLMNVFKEIETATKSACAALIKNGGADYDGSDVNP